MPNHRAWGSRPVTKERPEIIPGKLEDLVVNEVSPVDWPANGRTLLLRKNAGEALTPAELAELVAFEKGLTPAELAELQKAGITPPQGFMDVITKSVTAVLEKILPGHLKKHEGDPDMSQPQTPPATEQQAPSAAAPETQPAAQTLSKEDIQEIAAAAARAAAEELVKPLQEEISTLKAAGEAQAAKTEELITKAAATEKALDEAKTVIDEQTAELQKAFNFRPSGDAGGDDREPTGVTKSKYAFLKP